MWEGAVDRIRTDDRSVNSRVLHQLSYNGARSLGMDLVYLIFAG
jgi:hypothetical protein